jgi:hypothetical protein
MAIVDRVGLERRACECYRRIRLHAQRVLPSSPAPGGPCLS